MGFTDSPLTPRFMFALAEDARDPARLEEEGLDGATDAAARDADKEDLPDGFFWECFLKRVA